MLHRSALRLEGWLQDPGSGPDARILREEQLDRLARGINELPENQRTAVDLHYIHGATLAETAKQMGLTNRAVGRAHRTWSEDHSQAAGRRSVIRSERLSV